MMMTMMPYEKFAEDNGYKYKTEEEIKSAYMRRVKTFKAEDITEEDFIAEAGDKYEVQVIKHVYARLVDLFEKRRLPKAEILSYAEYKWCLRDANAIVAYRESKEKWHVNNCGDEVSAHEAIIRINREWGFEASQVDIIGTPYYCATDYQFICFECARVQWLWQNGSLYQVYAN